MKAPSNGFSANMDGDKKNMNSELWHACAGPLVSLPPVGSLVVYFPQGHSEQVAASMQKDTDSIPSYPSLPSKLICMLHNVILHADSETDEVYAQMTLQPVSKYDNDAFLASDLGLKQNKQPAEFFCKTLTASDTSTHGGFSVPRRSAEKIFPSLDFSMQPPAQELVARDLHDVAWTFRHIYRGQPKRHLLTTGWSVFVSTKRLIAGDSVLFIRDEKSQLLLGIRRANRQQPTLSSSVLSSDSMHIGILAAAAHAAANNSPFIIFYNPRASPSEFVIPLAKYQKAMYTQVSLGMRFRMMFETEESGVRRYMGTITGISDLDPIRWKNSQWRNLQVGWDESTAGERRNRVSLWEIEPAATPFYICPPPFFRPKFPGQPGLADDESEIGNAFRRAMPWLADDMGSKDTQNSIFPGLSLVQWMSIERQQQQQQNHQLMISGAQSGYFPSMLASSLTNNVGSADSSRILNFQTDPSLPLSNPQFCTPKPNQQSQSDQLPQPPLTAWSHQLQQTQLRQPPSPPVQIQQQQAQPTAMNAGVIHEQIQQRQQQQQLLQQHNNQQQLLQTQQQVGQTLPQAQLQNQILQQHLPQSQSPQQKFVAPTPQFQQNIHQQNHVLTQAKSLRQPQGEQQQPTVSQNPQQQFQLTQHHLQLQLLQKLQQQQQQQQMLSQLSTQVPSPLPQQQNSILEQQQIIGTHFSQPQLSQTQEISSNPALQHAKLQSLVRTNSAHTDVEVPSCSTSPSTNNCNLSLVKLPNKDHHGPSVVVQDKGMQTGPTSNLIEEIRSKPSVKVKSELPTSKEMDRLAYHGSAVTDQLDASSSATSFCLDGSNQANFSPFAFDGENQVDARNNLLFGVNIDGLTPDTLLSRGFDSGKDLQNLLSSYNQKDIETELSSVGINTQPFSVGDMSFKPGCSNDPVTDENGVLNRGMWSSQQPQRMRTFTKVHKRGSVGRSIDVTRYRGYEELRHDLACMFGIGQLEEPHRSDWKLVYVDHENDILLVGDDPWEEFVSCVQSIKILSSSEVQQMGIDGDLVNLSMPDQTRSGSDSGNAWRGHYDDNSGVAFDR